MNQEEHDEFSKIDGFSTAQIWHMRLAHASGEYINQLRKEYPEIKQLKKSVIDNIALRNSRRASSRN